MSITFRLHALVILLSLSGLVGSVVHAQPLPPVPAPSGNPLTEEKRVLGKMLFWDEQLSSDHTVACGTCHLSEFGGADPRLGEHPGLDGSFGTPDDVVGSPGVRRANAQNRHVFDDVFGLDIQVTGRSAQAFFGNLFAAEMFWDGRAEDTFVDPQTGLVSLTSGGGLESQAVGPILSDVEMAHEARTWDQVVAGLEAAAPLAMATDLPADVADVLLTNPTYPDLFEAAFGDSEITAERIAFAIASYERTLVADDTPWDRFVAGDPTALTAQELNGWIFFQGSRCSTCHAPPFFSDSSFRNIGLRPLEEDLGRAEVTGLAADEGRFKVPTLRNVGLKATFMHNGGLASLQQVINFYRGGPGVVQFPDNQDPLVQGGIPIPPGARQALLAFLGTGLTDARVASGAFPFDRPTLQGGQGICDDGLDNDADGLVDLADAGCSGPLDNTETADVACGLGFEVVPLLVIVMVSRRRRIA